MSGTVFTAFAGVSTVLVGDGRTSILVDGFFSRPPLRRLLTRVAPDERRIRGALDRLGVDRLDVVVVSHSHVDHALDAPVVARDTGAVLAGSRSTRMIAEGYGLADVPFRELAAGEPFAVGDFTLTPVHALHSDGDRVPGTIDAPLRVPAGPRAFRTGECFSVLLTHADGAVFVHPTANFIDGALHGYAADVVYLGAGAVGHRPAAWLARYWQQTVDALGARTVRPVHWDAFWRPLDEPLRPLPRRIDRLDRTMAAFAGLARPAGVDLALPRLWVREPLIRAVRR